MFIMVVRREPEPFLEGEIISVTGSKALSLKEGALLTFYNVVGLNS